MRVKLSDFGTQQQHPTQNFYKLGCAVVTSSGLAAVILGLGTSSATAQITIQSTGTLSGTIQLPKFNPNFNNRITRVDTDSSGTYYRNIGTKSNPNYVPVYKSDYVKVQTRADGSLSYFVDFKGVPVVSFDGILSSPVLSNGELTPYNYQGKLPGTKFQGVVQDEFGLTKGFYTGLVTDPTTGQQYEGTFEVNGQGPRYSDRNGGESPTVFDFRSDLPGKPTVTSYKMTNSPLVRLTVKVPADAKLVTPSSSTPTTGNSSTPTTNTGSNTTPTTGSSSTPTTGSSTPPTPPTSLPSPSLPLSTSPTSTTSSTSPTSPTLPLSPSPTPPTSPTPTPTLNMEFSTGTSFTGNSTVFNLAAICLRDCVNCRTKEESTPKRAIGPRSRVLLR
ncbi:hypothetical protein [Fischerella sp. PCC 9605]|uniref:hypothetical protein n=1 Tax=Fischerella sp. PCC 9605 TaxID=1173024 RepID=UPI00047900F0|nr:hypothetical protein [Fischerella sp. PCC 9605]